MRLITFLSWLVIGGSISTASAANKIFSTTTGGNWSATSTWVGGVLPASADEAVIDDGATVTIDTSPTVGSVVVGRGGATAILQFEQTTARTLTVTTDAVIGTSGVLRSNLAGTQSGHLLSVGGNLTNGGILSFATNAGATAGATLQFTGASNNTFGGSGSTTNIRTLVINKGSSNANILELNPAHFLVRGIDFDGAGMNFLTLTNGTLKISGTFPMSARTFGAANYSIASSAGFWLNNPNFTVAGQNAFATNYGLLRISQGTFNVGTAANNYLAAGSTSIVSGGTFLIEGGTLNTAGGFFGTVNSYSYTQTGGTVNVATLGVTSTSFYFVVTSFSAFTLSGGALNLVQATTDPSGLDYSVQAITTAITGGIVTVGTSATAPNSIFKLQGKLPELVIDNTTNAKEADVIPGGTDIPLTINGNLTIKAGSTLAFPTYALCNLIGPTLTNDGILNGSSARLHFGGPTPQSLTGSGMIVGPLLRLEVDNTQGLTIDSGFTPFIVLQVFLLNGGITHSNKLTLGNAGSTTVFIQIGNPSASGAPGSFDAAPSFNLGSGGEKLYYYNITTPRIMGFELSPGRVLTDLIISGGNSQIIDTTNSDLTVTGTTNLTNTSLVKTTNNLVIGSSGTLTTSLAFVQGNLQQTLTASGAKHFDVGTVAGGYLGLYVNGSGPFPATVTVRANDGTLPNYPGISLKRYWTVIAPPSLTASLTFLYRAGDLGPQDFTQLLAARYFGSFTAFSGTASSNTVIISNATALTGLWTLINPDTDFDGITDTYEDAHGLSKNNPADAVGDLDGDGLSNLGEYLAGTDPQLATSVLRITSLAKLSGTVPVHFNAIAGKTYRLEYEPTLPGTWMTLPIADLTAPATGDQQISDNTASGQSKRFYRIRTVYP